MTNLRLAEDYKKRAKGRRQAIEVLVADGLYADAVRECQKAAELGLKALIREAGHSVPMTHEVSKKLREIQSDLKPVAQNALDQICSAEHELQQNHEFIFYGSEDLTPSEFYESSDAERALKLLDSILAVL